VILEVGVNPDVTDIAQVIAGILQESDEGVLIDRHGLPGDRNNTGRNVVALGVPISLEIVVGSAHDDLLHAAADANRDKVDVESFGGGLVGVLQRNPNLTLSSSDFQFI